MAEIVVLWERPEGCLCGAIIAGEGGAKGVAGRYGAIRDTAPNCPQHGEQKAALEAALDAAEVIARTVPGVRLSRTQLHRLLEAAWPILMAFANGEPIPPAAGGAGAPAPGKK